MTGPAERGVGSIIAQPGDEVTETDILALRFLNSNGPDCVGPINSEEQFAAAIIFEGLKNRGLVIAALGEDGPTYRITPKGRAALPLEAA